VTAGLPACRSCGADGLALVLSLGRTPLANALLTEEQLTKPEPHYPLDLAFCPSCTLVQITKTVPPEELFSDYLYYSSFSDTMLRHAQSSSSAGNWRDGYRPADSAPTSFTRTTYWRTWLT
jgi:hypothetical protein